MATFDIYTGYNDEEATGRGAEYVYDGMNPADVLARFVANADLMHEIRGATNGELTEITAFNDEMTASAYPLEDGTFELHLHIGTDDIAITLPATPNLDVHGDSPLTTNDLVSVGEAADILGVHRNRVLQLINDGLLEARKVGQRWNISKASVESRAANPPRAGRRW